MKRVSCSPVNLAFAFVMLITVSSGCDPITRVYVRNDSGSKTVQVRSHGNMKFVGIEPGEEKRLMGIVGSTGFDIEFRYSVGPTYEQTFEARDVKLSELQGRVVVRISPGTPPTAVLASR